MIDAVKKIWFRLTKSVRYTIGFIGVVILISTLITIFSSHSTFSSLKPTLMSITVGEIVSGDYHAIFDTLITHTSEPGNPSGETNNTHASQVFGPYQVLSIQDGDTITVQTPNGPEYIRLIGVDAPEVRHSIKGQECFGPEAREFVTSLATDKTITYTTDPSQGLRDKYKRILAYVTLPDGSDLGELIISEGFAEEYTYAKKYSLQEKYRIAEIRARDQSLGLWEEGVCKANLY